MHQVQRLKLLGPVPASEQDAPGYATTGGEQVATGYETAGGEQDMKQQEGRVRWTEAVCLVALDSVIRRDTAQD